MISLDATTGSLISFFNNYLGLGFSTGKVEFCFLTTNFFQKVFFKLNPFIFTLMEKIDSHRYSVLKIIYSIVKEDGFPLKYRIHPRELILRSMEEWSSIQSALTALESEGLISIQQSDTVYVLLTGPGLEMCRTSQSM